MRFGAQVDCHRTTRGVAESMVGGLPTAKAEEYQRFDGGILAAFD